jgi:hypothetical protein
MKNFARIGLVALALIIFAPSADGQLTPVRIRVEKHQKTKNVRAEDQHGHYLFRTVSFSAEVFSMNAAPLPEVLVRWAVFGRQTHVSKDDLLSLFLVEGEEECSLSHGQTHRFETEPIDLIACPMSGGKGEILGHVFEVLVDGKVVASSVVPENAPRKIGAIKAAREKPNRNRF